MNFSPRALELIKYANDIAKKNNFDAVHPGAGESDRPY